MLFLAVVVDFVSRVYIKISSIAGIIHCIESCSKDRARVTCYLTSNLLSDEGFLKSFIESTETLTPDEKAVKLETDQVHVSDLIYL
jgi:hypothetical protein